ncbi:hypothetical protein RVX_R28480 [Nitratidesulfovibrio sp. HK-II]|uniref:hypothetical protein n=1 Tax=Nitratidesulfovibrio sp. HK-II TaxID=2009266 RepID=UPI000E2F68E4|nr:hypothetical protein [Nitratidesulfovibrio sp. HK-II]GBO97846.1 hypothetical protein RVX_2885 [Nitratidesulfovibrio sp. HK-II]
MARLPDAPRLPRRDELAWKGLTWVSRALLLLLVLALMDTVAGGFLGRIPLQVVRGEAEYLTAQLNKPVDVGTGFALETGPEDAGRLLDYRTDAVGLTLTFVEVAGRDWRALASVEQDTPTGIYMLQVFRRGDAVADKEPVHDLRVFSDQAAANSVAPTFCQRQLGFPPFYILFGIVPPLAACFYLSFRISGRRLGSLAAQGIAPIYRLTRRKQHWELLVGLGSMHGVTVGSSLVVLNRNKNPVDEAEVDTVERDTAHATLPLDSKVQPDFLVMLKPRG